MSILSYSAAMKQRVSFASGSLSVSAGWDGNDDLPSLHDAIEPGFLHVTESATQRTVYERVDALAHRIAWLLHHALADVQNIRKWNCVCTVRVTAGKTCNLSFEEIPDERGTRTDDMVQTARQADGPFVVDWIHTKAGYRKPYTFPPRVYHTGVILGHDRVVDDALIFEKNGYAMPVIRYWKEAEQEFKNATDYVTHMPFDALPMDAGK